jgi:hypothetical protein
MRGDEPYPSRWATTTRRCWRGQDNALARFRKALEKPLPADVRPAVERHLQLVQGCHAQMKMLRDQARAS